MACFDSAALEKMLMDLWVINPPQHQELPSKSSYSPIKWEKQNLKT